MKKIKLTLAALLLAGITLTSCSDDDGGSSTGAEIVGKWTPTKTVTTVTGAGSDTQNYEENEPGCDKDYDEFVTGGTLKEVVYFHNASNACTEDADATSTWSKADNTLTIDGQAYEITKLTKSALNYKYSTTVGGVTFTITEYFTKVN